MQQFLIGQRVRMDREAMGDSFPNIGWWIVSAAFDPRRGAILYGLSEVWPIVEGSEVLDGFLHSDLTLWPD